MSATAIRVALTVWAMTAAGCVTAQPPADAPTGNAPTETAPSSRPTADAVLAQAAALNRDAKFNDALDLLDGARKTFPNHAGILTALAKTFHLKADSQVAEGAFDINVQFHYEDVIRTAESVLERSPKHLEARLLAASARYQLGRLDEALVDAKAAVSAAPKSYGAHAMLGRVSLQRYIHAVQSMRQEPPPTDTTAARQREIDELGTAARAALKSASEADPNRSFPHIKLGDLSAWSGDLEGALPHYQAGLGRDPEAVMDHEWLRGAVDSNKLVALYRDAAADYAKRDGAKPEIRALLDWYGARATFDTQDWAGATRGFERALAARADLASSHQFLMLAAYERGEESKAAEHALAFATTAPRAFADRIRGDEYTKAILRSMAQQSFDAGRMIECRELNHVVALAANGTDEWNNYALLCRETGDYAKSFAAYQRALELEQSPQLLNDAAVILQYHLATPENLLIARDFYERAVERAEWLLVHEELAPELEERTRTALRDARANLRRL